VHAMADAPQGKIIESTDLPDESRLYRPQHLKVN
jgi:hypothetical protein